MNTRVLAIDDSVGDLKLIGNALQSALVTFAVSTAGTLEAGRALLLDGGFDVVLLDLGLPETTGIETLVACREFAGDLPIVVLTEQDDNELGAQLMRAGAQDCIPKSRIKDHQLARSIAHAIERNELNRTLQESNRELQIFAHRASHDLRAPLRRVCSLTGMLRLELMNSESDATEELMTTIESQATAMQAIVDGLLALSRASNTAPSFEQVELRETVDAALGNIATETRDVEFDVGQLPAVRGDRAWLISLFQNLLHNSAKYSPAERAQVGVSGRTSGTNCEVTITDNGIGLEPAQLEHMFTPFTRFSSAPEHEGSGIGLSLCRAIIERHGGMIWATSPGRGQGASIHLRLPLDNAA